jgi:NADH:ubiquinone oxidoreductase subunit 6 (subunit J)
MSIFIHGIEPFLFYLFASLSIASGIMVIRARNPVHSVLFLILVFCNAAGLLLLLGLDFFAMIFLVVYVGAIAVLFLFVVMILNIKVAELNESLSRYLPIGGLIGIIFLCEVFAIVDSDLIPMIQGSRLESFIVVDEETLLLLQEVFPSFFELFEETFGIETGISLLGNEGSTYSGFSEASYGYDFYLVTAMSSLQEVWPFFVEWSSLQKPTSNIQAVGQLIYTYYAYAFLVASLILLVAMIGAILLTMHKGVQVKRQEVFEQNTREFSKTLFMKKESLNEYSWSQTALNDLNDMNK